MIRLPGSHLPERLLADLADGSVREADIADRDRRHLEGCDQCHRLRAGHAVAVRLLAAPWSMVAIPSSATEVPMARVSVAPGAPSAVRRSRLSLMVAVAVVVLTVVIAFLAVVAGSRPPRTPDELLGRVEATATPTDATAPSPVGPRSPLPTLQPNPANIVVITPSPRDDICTLFADDDAAVLLAKVSSRIAPGTPIGGESFRGRGDGCVYGVPLTTRPGFLHGFSAQFQIVEIGATEGALRQSWANDLEMSAAGARTTVPELGDEAYIARGYFGKSGYIYQDGKNETMDGEQGAVIFVRDGSTYFTIRVQSTGDGGFETWSPNNPEARKLPTDHQLEMIAKRVLRRLT